MRWLFENIHWSNCHWRHLAPDSFPTNHRQRCCIKGALLPKWFCPRLWSLISMDRLRGRWGSRRSRLCKMIAGGHFYSNTLKWPVEPFVSLCVLWVSPGCLLNVFWVLHGNLLSVSWVPPRCYRVPWLLLVAYWMLLCATGSIPSVYWVVPGAPEWIVSWVSPGRSWVFLDYALLHHIVLYASLFYSTPLYRSLF